MEAAFCASRAAASIARFPDTIVCADCSNSSHCAAWFEMRVVTSSRLPAMSATSTPREPIRPASSAIRRALSISTLPPMIFPDAADGLHEMTFAPLLQVFSEWNT